ncbi:MAG: Ig-like domain-containing protein [Cyclobacteriaceae bacterium]
MKAFKVYLSILFFTLANGLYAQESWNQLGADIDGSMGDGLGQTVAFSSDGQTIAIAAPSAPEGSFKGLVRIYDKVGSSWTQRGVDIPGESDGDNFGSSLSLSDDGNTIAIGAAFKDLTSSFAPNGRVQIYEWNGNAWTQKGSNLDGIDDFENFGEAISLSGNGTRLAVGIPGQDTNGATSGGETGAVRVYEYTTDWTLLGSEVPGVEDYAAFGGSVSLDQTGNSLAVGSISNSTGGFMAGQVRVYRLNGSTWEPKGTTLSVFNGGENDAFGKAVSFSSDGNRLAIGAPDSFFGAGPTYIGYVQVWEYASENWTQVGSDITSNYDGDSFGQQLDLSGDGSHIIIGATGNFDTNNPNGRAQIWSFDATTWEQVGDDLVGEAADDLAGSAVGISADGSIAAIGAPSNQGGGEGAGTVQVYEFGELDTTAPTVSITSESSALTNVSPFSVTISFDESVTGFDVSDLSVENGDTGNFQTVSGSEYTVDIIPSSDGEVTIDIAAAAAQDASGNDSDAAEQFVRTYDSTAPTAVLTTLASSPTNLSPISVTITFSEEMSIFTAGDIAVNSGSASNLQTTDNIVYTADISPSADGEITIDVLAGVIQDLAGNDVMASNQLTLNYDATQPTVTITGVPSPIVASFTATFQFSEEVTGFEVSDITVDNCTAGNFQSIAADTYTAEISPTDDLAEGSIISLDVAATVATDLAGNENTAADQVQATYVPLFDGGSGTEADPYIISTKEDLKSLSENNDHWDKYFKQTADIVLETADFEVGGEFYNDGKGFSPIGNYNNPFSGSYDGGGHTISGLYIDRPDQNYVGFIGNNTGFVEDLGLVNVNIKDGHYYIGGLIGYNDGSLSRCYVTGSVSGIDHIGGLVGTSIGGAISNCYSTSSVLGGGQKGGLIGSFSDNQDANVSNCYSTGLVSEYYGGGLIGTIWYNYDNLINCFWDTETSGHTNAAMDGDSRGISGLTTAEMQDQTSFTGWDFENVWQMCGYPVLQWEQRTDCPPTISGEIALSIEENTTNVASYTANKTVTWSLSGTDGELFDIDTEGTITFKVDPDFETPGDANSDNVYELSVNATDAESQTVSLEVTITISDVDENAPEAVFEIAPTITSEGTFMLVAFSDDDLVSFEEVVGFELEDITVSNGTASDLQPFDSPPNSFIVFITPTATEDVTVEIAAGVVADLAGNANLGSGVHTLAFNDQLPPVVTIDTLYTNDQTPTLTGTIDDPDATISVTVNEVGHAATNNGDGTWTLADNTLTALTEGEYETTVVATDEFDNESDPIAGLLVIDLTAPSSVFINGAVTQLDNFEGGVNVQPLIVKVIFYEGFGVLSGDYEEVFGLTKADIVVNADTTSTALAPSQTDNSFFLAINLNNPEVSQEITITVPEGAAMDLAGNATGAYTVTFSYDVEGPVVTSFETTGPTNTTSIPASITFDEFTRGVSSEDFTISNGAISDLTTDTDSLTYTFNIVPEAEGEITVQLGEASVEDKLGNVNTAASEVLSFTYDATVPTVDIAFSADTTNVSPVVTTITFSEEIVLLADSLTVTGGIISGLNTTDNMTYTASIVPEGSVDAPITGFEITVTLEAGKVQDAAGNLNETSVERTVVFDDVVPVISFVDFGNNPITSVNADFPGGFITFSEMDEITIIADDVTVNGGTFEFQLSDFDVDGDGEPDYGIALTQNEGIDVIEINIAAAVVTDAAGNTSAATTFSIAVDNVAPTVEITSELSGSTNESPIPVTFTFSEEVRKRTGNIISVSSGFSLGELETEDDITFTALVTPTVEEGTLSLTVGAGVYADLVGNKNTASETFTLIYDTKSPTLTIDAPETVNSGDPFTVTFNFDEAIVSFDASNVTVTNGTLGAITADGNTYTASVTPGEEGNIIITATVVKDAAGNTTTELSRTILYDGTRPTITIKGVLEGQIIQSPVPEPIAMTFEFSEDVVGFEMGKIDLTNASMNNFNAISSSVYTADITPLDTGQIKILIIENVVEDEVGNGNQLFSLSYTYDPKYNGGTGTNEDPYQIATDADLRELSISSDDWGSSFLQTADIEMSSSEYTPIGSRLFPFTGTFNGQHYQISGLQNVKAVGVWSNNTSLNSAEKGKGLFGTIQNATLSNIALTNININAEGLQGAPAIGGLVASNGQGNRTEDGEGLSLIENCFVSGKISIPEIGVRAIGGLVGFSWSTLKIQGSFTSVRIESELCNIGGLLGDQFEYELEILNCYSSSILINKSGIDSKTGGLVGDVRNLTTIVNSYFSGKIEGVTEVGGLVGQERTGDTQVTGSFWDTELSGVAVSPGGGTGLSTSEMRKRETYADAGWDLTNTWIHSGEGFHPVLKWQVDNAKPFTVSGKVVDKDGEPFSQGTVKANFNFFGTILTRATVELNNDGTFSMVVPEGIHSILVEPKISETEHVKTYYGDANRSTLSRHVLNSVTDIQIQMIAKTDPNQLTGNGVVNGRVVDAGSGSGRIVQGRILEGEGLEGVTVFLVRTSDGEILTQVETDANGDFEITGIPAGDYQLLLDVVGIDVNLEGSSFSMDEEGTPLTISAAVSEEGISFAVEEVLNVEDEIAIEVYPNPVQEILNVRMEGNATVRLMNLQGQLLFEKSFTDQTTINVQELTEGVHLLEIVDANGKKSVRKLIKLR